MTRAAPDDANARRRWTLALRAAALFAVDPSGLGGVWLRARVGGPRQRWLAALEAALAGAPPASHTISEGAPWRLKRAPSTASEEALARWLEGGLDMAETLRLGRPVRAVGLGEDARVVVTIPMAERLGRGAAARLAAALDAGRLGLALLDEGVEAEEGAPASLTDRTAFWLDLDAIPIAACVEAPAPPEAIAAARTRLGAIALNEDAARDLTLVAARFGIGSLRPPLLALRTARAAAALSGRTELDAADLAEAVALSLAPRALAAPDDAETPPEERAEKQQEEPPAERDPDDASDREEDGPTPPIEALIEAAKAMLPPGALAALQSARAPKGAADGGGSDGAKVKGARRGRPLPARRGKPDAGARLDVVETLRAAAPWQPLRRRAQPDATARVLLRGDDLRVRRFERATDRLLIFLVDASGSTAMARLAEVKGAIELMLAEAYATRDHVALVAFRGEGADVLLGPTRSLTHAKRRLARLPGGGGTPLAAGLKAAFALAQAAKRRGLAPSLAVLTDGRGNIALDGAVDRAAAAADAERMAALWRADGGASLVIDAGARPNRAAASLAQALGGGYLALPRADARRMSEAVGAAWGREAAPASGRSP